MTTNDPLTRVLSLLEGVKDHGGYSTARCPAHQDDRSSLSVSLGNTGAVILKCHAGCSFDAIVAALGLHKQDLWPHRNGNTGAGPEKQIAATYDYTDAGGTLLYQAVRYKPKGFAQRRPDGRDGWIWNLKGVKRVPYRLPDLIAGVAAGKTIYIVEGEKDADNLRALGLVATTNAAGAGKWSPEFREHFAGAAVVILPDNDAPGRDHAAAVARSLHGAAASIRMPELPGLPEKGDVSDWLKADGTRAALEALVAAACEWKPGDIPRAMTEAAREPRLLHASELSARIPKTTWLIPGVLAMNKLSQTFALPGSGKSFTELDKALCIAQRYPVVYVAAEALEDYEDRVDAWCRHYQRDRGQLYFWPEPIHLRSPLSVEEFIEEIRPIGPVAIFVDPLASCMVGLEESSTGDMTVAVEALNRIRRATGAAVHVVHHTGWSDAHERGSSVLRAACRIVMKLSLDDSGLMTLTCEKANNGKPFEARYFRLVESGSSAVPVPADRITLRDAPLSPRQIEVMEALDMAHFKDGATFTQIQEHVDRAKSTVNKTIDRLIQLGYIHFDESKRTRYYTLSPAGVEELQRRLADTVTGAGSPVHQGGELGVNWTVNSIQTESASSPEMVNKRAAVHREQPCDISPEFTGEKASSCESSPAFIPSSPSVHPGEFTSSPRVCPLGHTGSELNGQRTGEPLACVSPAGANRNGHGGGGGARNPADANARGWRGIGRISECDDPEGTSAEGEPAVDAVDREGLPGHRPPSVDTIPAPIDTNDLTDPFAEPEGLEEALTPEQVEPAILALLRQAQRDGPEGCCVLSGLVDALRQKGVDRDGVNSTLAALQVRGVIEWHQPAGRNYEHPRLLRDPEEP